MIDDTAYKEGMRVTLRMIIESRIEIDALHSVLRNIASHDLIDEARKDSLARYASLLESLNQMPGDELNPARILNKLPETVQ